MAEFKPGDTVKLKSGGPLMTVDVVNEYGFVNCEWFAEKNELKERSFSPTSLMHDDDDIKVTYS